MTPHEKAVNAINARIARLQASLRDAKTETAQQFLVQSLVVSIGMAEALNDYIKSVGHYAQRRHAEVKRVNETLQAQHAELLNAAKQLLEKLKANPADAGVRKEIERTQQTMSSVQKAVRRSANALQRELAPGLAMIDRIADSVRRLSGAGDSAALKRLLKTVVGHARELYATHPALPAKDIVATEAWEKSVAAEIDRAAGFDDAYARSGYQATVAFELMALALSENPPRTPDEATQRSNESAAARLRQITARLGGT
jgi:hypothetical protein